MHIEHSEDRHKCSSPECIEGRDNGQIKDDLNQLEKLHKSRRSAHSQKVIDAVTIGTIAKRCMTYDRIRTGRMICSDSRSKPRFDPTWRSSSHCPD